jgi:hypothetical protein
MSSKTRNEGLTSTARGESPHMQRMAKHYGGGNQESDDKGKTAPKALLAGGN